MAQQAYENEGREERLRRPEGESEESPRRPGGESEQLRLFDDSDYVEGLCFYCRGPLDIDGLCPARGTPPHPDPRRPGLRLR